jgi:CubicO group peptidase (beta-lactamase class C family)
MVATADKITYQGAFGKRDVAKSGARATPDSIFAIASMTKAITSTAALQLVDQGKLKLDEPVSKHIPEFAKLEVRGLVSEARIFARCARLSRSNTC